MSKSIESRERERTKSRGGVYLRRSGRDQDLVALIRRALGIDELDYAVDKIEEILEKIEKINERLDRIEKAIAKTRGASEAREERVREVEEREAKTEVRAAGKKTAIDILRERGGYLFESDLSGRIRDVDALFNALKRQGAIVAGEKPNRVAVSREYLNTLISMVNKGSILAGDAAKILEIMKREGIVVEESGKQETREGSQ
jgi:hypothetical protein